MNLRTDIFFHPSSHNTGSSGHIQDMSTWLVGKTEYNLKLDVHLILPAYIFIRLITEDGKQVIDSLFFKLDVGIDLETKNTEELRKIIRR